jgi:hypothetical protein
VTRPVSPAPRLDAHLQAAARTIVRAALLLAATATAYLLFTLLDGAAHADAGAAGVGGGTGVTGVTGEVADAIGGAGAKAASDVTKATAGGTKAADSGAASGAASRTAGGAAGGAAGAVKAVPQAVTDLVGTGAGGGSRTSTKATATSAGSHAGGTAAGGGGRRVTSRAAGTATQIGSHPAGAATISALAAVTTNPPAPPNAVVATAAGVTRHLPDTIHGAVTTVATLATDPRGAVSTVDPDGWINGVTDMTIGTLPTLGQLGAQLGLADLPRATALAGTAALNPDAVTAPPTRGQPPQTAERTPAPPTATAIRAGATRRSLASLLQSPPTAGTRHTQPRSTPAPAGGTAASTSASTPTSAARSGHRGDQHPVRHDGNGVGGNQVRGNAGGSGAEHALPTRVLPHLELVLGATAPPADEVRHGRTARPDTSPC